MDHRYPAAWDLIVDVVKLMPRIAITDDHTESFCEELCASWGCFIYMNIGKTFPYWLVNFGKLSYILIEKLTCSLRH